MFGSVRYFNRAEMSEDRYLKLLEEIKRHDHLYFDLNTPEITDYEYDLLVKEAKEYEATRSDTPSDNPLKKVAESPVRGFRRIKHDIPMLSLSNTYSRQEVSDFIDRVRRWLGKEEVRFLAELKLDGVAVSVRYEKGVLTRALSRGDGHEGEEITAQLKTIASLPEQLSGDSPPDCVEVRGEVFIPKADFVAMNRSRTWANPRNAAAGSLKLLDPEETRKRPLAILFYSVLFPGGYSLTQEETHSFLRKVGLPAMEERHTAICRSTEEIFAFAARIEAEREALPFEIDGIVIKTDDPEERDRLGHISKSPRSATAYKFTPEQGETVIEKITVQVGRTGVLTPVALLTPVSLAGSTISRVSLHNAREIARKDIRVGDHVIIVKGGDIIPKVLRVIPEKRGADSRPWHMPATCPVCGSPVVREEGGVATRCASQKTCGGKHLRRLLFFVGKEGMDIEGMGPEVVKRLIDAGLVSSFSDIYLLKGEDLRALEGFRDKAADNLLRNIERSKTVPLTRFLSAIGIPYVGKGVARLVAEHRTSLEKVRTASFETLSEIYGIGEKSASAVVAFFADPGHAEEIDDLLAVGIRFEPTIRTIAGHPFEGKTFVLTGSLTGFTRARATDLIKERGGRVTASISEKTDFLLLGKDPGSKYEKAERAGITIMTAEEFAKAIAR
ncbi:MAG: NAD-dependent DNA ligase LigA [Simkaniaceae bacterium]|nr:NAD-dependent DNA ligase LigA [Simkaniaceae bacterium]